MSLTLTTNNGSLPADPAEVVRETDRSGSGSKQTFTPRKRRPEARATRADLEKLLTITHAAVDAGDTLAARQRFVCRELSEWFGNQATAVSRISSFLPDRAWTRFSGVVHSTMEPEKRQILLEARIDPNARHPIDIRLRKRMARHTKATARYVAVDRQFQKSQYHEVYGRLIGIGPAMHVIRRVGDDPGEVISLCCYRPTGGRPFTKREQTILEVLMDRVPWMTMEVPPEEADYHPDLTPRLREVLDRLLAGDSEAAAARQLGLTRNTLHGYVKDLYRTYAVKSRAELLAKFIRR